MVMMGKMGGLKASTKFKESTNKDQGYKYKEYIRS